MPNYVINKLQLVGESEKVKEVMDYIKSDDGEDCMDFRKIVPIPPHIYQGNLGNEHRDLFGDDTWLEWCNKYWGTKWNAICEEDADKCTADTIYFQTAWGSVIKLIYLLSARFRDVQFIYEFADEDYGFNCERHVIKELSFANEHYRPDGGSKEAEAFALALWGEKEEADNG